VIRRHFFLIAAAAFLVLMLIAGGLKLATAEPKGKGGPGGAGGRATAVSQAVVALRPFADSIEALGVAKGRESVTITSNTSELVTAVRFSDGQRVTKGQVLVELKSGEEDAGLIEAQARLAQAERDYTRWKSLADQGIAPKATAEQYRSALDTARAGAEAARPRKLDRALRAPFVQIPDERHARAVVALYRGIRRFDQVVLVRRVRAAAMAEAEVAGGQAQWRVGEDEAGV